LGAFCLAASPAIIDRHVNAFLPSKLLQATHERRDAQLRFRVVLVERLEYADPPWLLAPLCTRRERPYGRQTAEECDEIAAAHVRPGLRDRILTARTQVLIEVKNGIEGIFAERGDVAELDLD
jgi:hypothetical protein